jgi:malate/lactate dehydrogenase
VTMTAGVARKPGMTRDDLFDINAGIVKGALPSLEHSSPPVARRL